MDVTYKTNEELEQIVNAEKFDNYWGKDCKPIAKNELERRKAKSFEELNYDLNLKQTKKINIIAGVAIFFTVLTVLSLIIAVYKISQGM